MTDVAAGKRVILPPSRHDPDAAIEHKGPNMRGGVHEYPPFGCAEIKPKPDPHTREGSLIVFASAADGLLTTAPNGTRLPI